MHLCNILTYKKLGKHNWGISSVEYIFIKKFVILICGPTNNHCIYFRTFSSIWAWKNGSPITSNRMNSEHNYVHSIHQSISLYTGKTCLEAINGWIQDGPWIGVVLWRNGFYALGKNVIRAGFNDATFRKHRWCFANASANGCGMRKLPNGSVCCSNDTETRVAAAPFKLDAECAPEAKQNSIISSFLGHWATLKGSTGHLQIKDGRCCGPLLFYAFHNQQSVSSVWRQTTGIGWAFLIDGGASPKENKNISIRNSHCAQRWDRIFLWKKNCAAV